MAIVLNRGRVVLFVHVPKCAGTSVTSLLGGLGEVRFDDRVRLGRHWIHPRHLTATSLEKIFVKEMFDYSFMMVRNPVERLLSEFRYQSRKAFPRWQLFLGFDRWLAWSLKRAARHPGYRQNHFRRQVEFRAFECDVFRIEDGLAPLVQKLNAEIDAKLPEEPEHLNPSPRRDLRMSLQSLDLILTTYADDFTAFGYPEDPDHYQHVLR